MGFMDIDRLLLAGDFAFNCQTAVKAVGLEPFEQRREVDLAIAHLHFAAQLAAIGGIKAILGMHAADIVAKHVQRIRGVGLAV